MATVSSQTTAALTNALASGYGNAAEIINVLNGTSTQPQITTSASANAEAVGPNGTTNPTLLVDCSTTSAATGIKIKSAAAAAGLAVSVISSGTDENLTIDAKGAGTITLGGTSTGGITLTRAVTPTAGIVYGSRTKRVGGKIRAGATAGWTFTATDTGSMANVAASQTNSTAIVWLEGLNVGDVITGFNVYASIASAGNTVTLDANLRTLTVAAAGTGTDASITTMTQVSVTSNTASTSNKTGINTTVVAGVVYYILLKATTGASCTIELESVEVVITPNPVQ